RYFVNKTAPRILNLTGGGVINYIGNYDYYLEKREDAERAYLPDVSVREETNETVAEESAAKTDWKTRKEEQARQRKRQNQINRLEDEIAKLEERLSQIDDEFAKPEIATNSFRLGELHGEQMELTQKLEKQYRKWEELSEEE
ncbi:MAG: ABC transporter ATP-binding protein, partial [Clostridiales bacterium]|nr:ABC transporter ATP-binding protein [Clostridiales bacterium]